MRLLFCGTPDFAATVLEALLRGRHPVIGVMTQPGRPQGRGLAVEDPPAAKLARAAGLPLLQPERPNSPESREALARLEPDLIVTAAFGRILRAPLLALPSRGCWNVHASLLPRHRGAAPVSAALRLGDAWTGVTVFRMDEGLDTGPMLAQEMTAIGPAETAGELTDRLAAMGGRVLGDALEREEAGALRPVPQPAWGATYASMLCKDDGRVRWDRPVEQVDRMIRAVTPWPGAFTFVEGKRMRIHRAIPVHRLETEFAGTGGSGEAGRDSKPCGPVPAGTVVRLPAGWDGIGVVCRPGLIALLEVQSEGRKRQEAAIWLRGTRVAEGAILDPPA